MQKDLLFYQQLKKTIPHHSINYPLQARKWHTPRDRGGVALAREEITEQEKLRRLFVKERRYHEKQGLYRDA